MVLDLDDRESHGKPWNTYHIMQSVPDVVVYPLYVIITATSFTSSAAAVFGALHLFFLKQLCCWGVLLLS